MISLEKLASLVATYYRGFLKQAFFKNIKCLIVRNETEWFELVESGWNNLVNPANTSEIYFAIIDIFNHEKTIEKPNLYGNGYASKKIVEKIVKFKS